VTALRPLNRPVPIGVEAGVDGEPAFVTRHGTRIAVTAVLDRWRIDDEWWREPIARLYRRLLLADDRVLTVFEDLLGGRWYAQRYGRARSVSVPPRRTTPRAAPRRRPGRFSRSGRWHH
jgi:hypothetical protein